MSESAIAYVNHFPFCGNHAEWRRFRPLLFCYLFSSGLSVCGVVTVVLVQSRDMFVAGPEPMSESVIAYVNQFPFCGNHAEWRRFSIFLLFCYFFPCGLSFFSHTLEWLIREMELSMMSMDILKVRRSHHDVLIMRPIDLPLQLLHNLLPNRRNLA